ncbi:MAG: tetratricopeptide repeat protein, partial [Candidatus Peribacteraceae bacterium]|nr:tetratricopeptide repeat protein [Candidatus Peribacteraceae bacterium]
HNLLHHILNAGLFGLLSYHFLKNRSAALFVAFLFLVHPIHTEAVIWATGRKDLLSTTFFLLSLHLYLRFLRKPSSRTYAGSLLTFFLGLLSKITVVSLPLLLFLIDWLEGRKLTRQSVIEKLPYIALSLVFGIVALFGKSGAPDLSLLTHSLVAAKSFTFSLSKIFFPTGLSPMYAYTGTISLQSGDFLLSLLIVFALVAVAVMMRKRWKLFAFSVAFTMITFLPSFANLIKNGDYYLTADRYAYIPSMGVFLLAGFLLLQAENRVPAFVRRGMLPLAILFLLFLSFLSSIQSSVWKDSETLSRYVTQVSPNARLGHLWYGNALREAGKSDEALAEYDLALSFKDDPKVFYNRALAREEQGQPDAAVADYQKALTLSPDYALAHINLGRLLYGQGKKDEARTHFVAATVAAPLLAMPFFNLGVLEGEARHFDLAADFYRQALDRDPDLHDARANLAIALLALGKNQEAVDQLKETLKRDPENLTALATLEKLLRAGVVTK